MDIELRPITPEEFTAFHHAANRGFGEHATEQDVELSRSIFDFEGSLAAFAGERIAGTGVIFPFRLTVPGNCEVRAGGVSWITVQPDFRRRGILTAMMRRQFEDARGRGEPLTILYASESIIYGRFGYGMATDLARFQIDTRHGDFARAPETTGTVRFADKDEARALIPEIYDRVRRQRPGGLEMLPGWWDHFFADPESWWQGAGPRFNILYRDADGEPRGFASYRVAAKWEGGLAQSTLRLSRLETETAEARAALWRFVLSIDLVQTVEAQAFPIDEPVRFMLADTRRLQVTQFGDGLWVRLIDIPASLEARRYRVEDEVVLEVQDPFLPENRGRYLLHGGPNGAACTRTDRSPDVRLHVADLGAVYLGGTPLMALANAGRVHELTPGGLDRADLMFSSAVTPFVGLFF